MKRAECSIGWRSRSKVRLCAFFFIFVLAAQMSSQTAVEARQGALEVTSDLGRKPYGLPGDEKVIEARRSLALDPGSQIVSSSVGKPVSHQSKAIAESSDYPSIVADGSTDTCISFQAFIDAHPGQTLLVRKVAGAKQGGGSASTIDYYSSCTLHLKFNGTILEGNVNELWQGSPVFLFAAGVTGFQIDPSCMGCGIRDVEVAGGGKPYGTRLACYNSSNSLVYPFTGSADGIVVYGGEPLLERTATECFNRDGIHIDGTNVSIGGFIGQPDDWKIYGGMGSQNQHDNLYIHGADSNAGIEQGFQAYGAGGWGFQDDAQLGNTHIGSFTTSNGRDAGIMAKATSPLSSISCSSYTCTVVTSSPVAGIQNGIWIVIAGTKNYNGVYYVTGYTDTQHFSFTWVASNRARETSGTVGVDGSTHMFANAIRSVSDASCTNGQATLYSQSAQFGVNTQVGAKISLAGAGSSGALLTTTISAVTNEYTAQLATKCLTAVRAAQASYTGGISHGPYMSNTTAVANTWITPYMESDQNAADMAYGNYIYGGNMAINWGYGLPIEFGANGTIYAQHWNQFAPSDLAQAYSTINCGKTRNVPCNIFIQNYNGSESWSLSAPFNIANEIQIKDYSSKGIVPFDAIHGGTTDIAASTNVTLNPGSGYQVKTAAQIASSLATGTAPFSIVSTTNVPNLNASSLNGATFAAPGEIGRTTPASVMATTYNTATNCSVNSASPAICGSATSGAVVIPAKTTSYTINTSAVTSHSRIQLTWLTFASDLPSSPTCVAPSGTSEPTISAVSPGISFTISMTGTNGQTCPMFTVMN